MCGKLGADKVVETISLTHVAQKSVPPDISCIKSLYKVFRNSCPEFYSETAARVLEVPFRVQELHLGHGKRPLERHLTPVRGLAFVRTLENRRIGRAVQS